MVSENGIDIKVNKRGKERLVPVAFLAMFMLYEHFVVPYTDVDNYLISLILNNSFSQENFTFYINILLCRIVKFLHCLYPGADWFLSLCEVMIAIAVFFAFRLCCEKFEWNLLKCIPGCLVCLSFYCMLDPFHTNYTAIPGIVFPIGWLLVIENQRGQTKIANRIGGFAILCFSFLLRPESILVMIPFAGLSLLYVIYEDVKSKDDYAYKRLKYVAVLFVIFVGLLGLQKYMKSTVYADEVMYSELRASVVDYKTNGVTLLHFLMDTDGMDVERLRSLSESEEPFFWENQYKDSFGIEGMDLYANIEPCVLRYSPMGITILIALFLLLALRKKKIAIIFSTVFQATVGILVVLVYFDGKKGILIPNRIVANYPRGMVVAVLLAFLFVYIILHANNQMQIWLTILGLCGGLVVLGYFAAIIGRAPERVVLLIESGVLMIFLEVVLHMKEYTVDLFVPTLVWAAVFAVSIVVGFTEYATGQNVFAANVLDYSETENEATYVWDTHYFNKYVFDEYGRNGKLAPEAFLEKNLKDGEWYYGQKYYNDFLEQIGVNNPMKALFENEDFYYICDIKCAEMIKDYYPEGERYTVETVGEKYGYPINRYVLIQE